MAPLPNPLGARAVAQKNLPGQIGDRVAQPAAATLRVVAAQSVVVAHQSWPPRPPGPPSPRPLVVESVAMGEVPVVVSTAAEAAAVGGAAAHTPHGALDVEEAGGIPG